MSTQFKELFGKARMDVSSDMKSGNLRKSNVYADSKQKAIFESVKEGIRFSQLGRPCDIKKHRHSIAVTELIVYPEIVKIRMAADILINFSVFTKNFT